MYYYYVITASFIHSFIHSYYYYFTHSQIQYGKTVCISLVKMKINMMGKNKLAETLSVTVMDYD